MIKIGSLFLHVAVIVLALAFASSAHAADLAVSAPIALSDALTAFVTMLAGCLLVIIRGVGRAAIAWFEAQTKVRVDGSLRTLLDDLCHRGLDYAEAMADRAIDSAKPAIDNQDALVSQAVGYVMAHAPEALAHFGLDEAGVERMILARLGIRANPAAATAAALDEAQTAAPAPASDQTAPVAVAQPAA